jgi:hypothetical protein
MGQTSYPSTVRRSASDQCLKISAGKSRQLQTFQPDRSPAHSANDQAGKRWMIANASPPFKPIEEDTAVPLMFWRQWRLAHPVGPIGRWRCVCSATFAGRPEGHNTKPQGVVGGVGSFGPIPQQYQGSNTTTHPTPIFGERVEINGRRDHLESETATTLMPKSPTLLTASSEVDVSAWLRNFGLRQYEAIR